ncbi:MAG: recombinase family protein [Roseburia sp.]
MIAFLWNGQAEELRRYAEQAGYTIVGAAAEHVSGMTLDRPALQEVMEAVLAGRWMWCCAAGTGEHRQLQLFTIFYIKKQSVHYRILRSYKDTLHGASDGKVFWGYGHLRPGYWERENVLQKETFAQFGRILYDQDDDVLKMTEEIFENTSREVLERIKGMMK